jgi:integrase-like protein
MLETAGLRQIRIHDLRHTYATHLVQMGVPITYVSEQVGHADVSITWRVYAHYMPKSSQREGDRLDETVPEHPNASQAHPEASKGNDELKAKSLRMNGEPYSNRIARSARSLTRSPKLAKRESFVCPFANR